MRPRKLRLSSQAKRRIEMIRWAGVGGDTGYPSDYGIYDALEYARSIIGGTGVAWRGDVVYIVRDGYTIAYDTLQDKFLWGVRL